MRATRAQTTMDDDELRARLREAAKGRIRKTCVNVKPIRELMAKGCDLDRDILPFIAEAFPGLTRPLGTWGGDWPCPDILAFSQERRAAAERGARRGAADHFEKIFISADSPLWPRASALYRHSRNVRTGPPAFAHSETTPGAGWYFPVAVLASDEELAAMLGLREAAE